VEEWFEFELTDSGGGAPVRFHGKIDRIDRLPDGSIEIIDYKTGRSKTQGQVDKDDQLSIYSLALREGAVLDKSTGQPLPPASSLALYFTESDQKITTTRSDEQLDEFVAKVWATVRRIRSGDFVATPSYSACGYCDFRRICPSRFGADRI
jgi:RecB family exonuclease